MLSTKHIALIAGLTLFGAALYSFAVPPSLFDGLTAQGTVPREDGGGKGDGKKGGGKTGGEGGAVGENQCSKASVQIIDGTGGIAGSMRACVSAAFCKGQTQSQSAQAIDTRKMFDAYCKKNGTAKRTCKKHNSACGKGGKCVPVFGSTKRAVATKCKIKKDPKKLCTRPGEVLCQCVLSIPEREEPESFNCGCECDRSAAKQADKETGKETGKETPKKETDEQRELRLEREQNIKLRKENPKLRG